MHNKAKYAALGATAGAVALVCPVLMPFAFIFFGIKAQKMQMEDDAEEKSRKLNESDDVILDAVDRFRPDARKAVITHVFPLENNAGIPIFQTGISQTIYNPRSGRREKKIRVTF